MIFRFDHGLRIMVAIAVLTMGLIAKPAPAGPPYVTDDPVPTDIGHWEIYTFSENNLLHGADDGQVGFDINYGLINDVQLTTTISGQYANGDVHGLQFADTEVGFKYRFIDDKTHGFQASVFPKLILPTAPGAGRVAYELPVWLQQDFGKWSIFGGGSVTIRSGEGARNSWQQGIALTRQLSDNVSLGIEVAHDGPEDLGGHGATTVGIGATLHVHGPFSLIGAAGPVIEDGAGRTGARAYAAVLTNF